MVFSFTAFLVTQICVCILISIWCFILNKKWAMKKLYLNFWLFITPVIVIRMLLPFEFPYTVTIPSETILPPISHFFYYPIHNGTRTVGGVFVCIWILGFVISMIYYHNKNQKTRSLVDTLIYGEKEEAYEAILLELGYGDFLKKKEVRIFKTKYVTTPVVIGNKKPVILLPDIIFTEKELHYILAHEMTHLVKNDTRILTVMTVLQCAFWWNPFMYLFRKEITKLLELRVDGMLTEHYDKYQITEYVECVLNVYKYQVSLEKEICISGKRQMLAFTRKGESEFLKRINYLLSKHSYVYSYLIAGVFVITAIFSTGFVFEPYSITAEDAEGTFSIEEDGNNYLVQKKDGSYDVYIEGTMIGNIIEIPKENIYKDFKIYKSEEDIK